MEQLNQFGQTLALGAFATYGIWYLFAISWDHKQKNLLPGLAASSKTSESLVYFAVAFVVGLVLENYSKGFVSTRQGLYSSVYRNVLDTDNEIRLRSLFKRERDKNTVTFRPRRLVEELGMVLDDSDIAKQHKTELSSLLGMELKAAKPSIKIVKSRITKVPDPDAHIPDKPDKQISEAELFERQLETYVGNLYYTCKNRVYKEDTYFQEMSAISLRSNFTRAFSLLSLLLFAVYSMFLLMLFLSNMCKRPSARSSAGCVVSAPPETFVLASFGARPAPPEKSKVNSGERSQVLAFAVICAVSYWLCKEAHKSEETNHNNRAFGYYVSLMSSPHDSEGEAGKHGKKGGGKD